MNSVYSRIPSRFVLDKLTDAEKITFAKFFTYCTLEGRRKEELLAELVANEMAAPAIIQLMNRRWMKWEDLQPELKAKGFGHSRSTIWRYRNEGLIAEEYVRKNSIGTMYD